jgi:alkylation response protein AidB-like acyl-CoA dehydrogenase
VTVVTSSPDLTELRASVQSVVEQVVAPRAGEVDACAAFPRAGIDALAQAGLLGLTSASEVGGSGAGLRAAAQTIEQLAGACGSTAMVVLMHYAALTVIEAHGPEDVRKQIAAGKHLSTLAFSEVGRAATSGRRLARPHASTATSDSMHKKAGSLRLVRPTVTSGPANRSPRPRRR